MKIAELIVRRLSFLGVDTAFVVTGGAAMHLNDALGQNENIDNFYLHHEQALSMAAEGYARIKGKPAIVNVTAGPGVLNTLNGVFGAYTDSIPMFVISGQVKRETLLAVNPIKGLRQLGDQELDTITTISKITKKSHLLLETNPNDIVDIIDELFKQCISGRMGPVWLDVPVDIQGINVAFDEKVAERELKKYIFEMVEERNSNIEKIYSLINSSRKVVILAGTGIKLSNTQRELLEISEELNVPVVTAWAHDIFPNNNKLYGGRAGTIGTRAGNFIIQNSDLVIILGSRLNIRQISYNFESFAKKAKKVWVDIDQSELNKPFTKVDVSVCDDLKELLPALLKRIKLEKNKINENWIKWCQGIVKDYSPKPEDYPISEDRINAYHFIEKLFKEANKDDVFVCANATATIVPYQIGILKENMHLISNSGSASMGHELPTAIGTSVAKPDTRTICLAGDGSIMMNIQELQSIANLNLNVIIFVLANDGYLSIKQTQKNFFGVENGASASSGVTFPDFELVGNAFGINSYTMTKDYWKKELKNILEKKGPLLVNVPLDLIQEFEPRLKSKMEKNRITTPDLDDMYPFISQDELNLIRESSNEK